jgi:peptidylprolyl isomerase
VIVIAFILIATLAWYQSNSSVPPPASAGRVVLVTSKGDITIELYGDMPITTGNFKNLTRLGMYNGTIFHRIVHDFVIQGGKITEWNIPPIRDEGIGLHSNVEGSVAMAKTDQPNSATSQFYISLKDNTDLDSNYSVFGRVVNGMWVVKAIGEVPTLGDYDENLTPPDSEVPVDNVYVTAAYVIE